MDSENGAQMRKVLYFEEKSEDVFEVFLKFSTCETLHTGFHNRQLTFVLWELNHTITSFAKKIKRMSFL